MEVQSGQKTYEKEDSFPTKLKSNENDVLKKTQNLNHDLDNVLVQATSKRRKYPRQIKSSLAQRYKAQLDTLVKTKFQPSGSRSLSAGRSYPDLPSPAELSSPVTTAFSALTALSKSTSLTVERGERLEKSYRLCHRQTHCPIQQVLYHPSPGEDKMASSITPLRSRLGNLCRSPVSVEAQSGTPRLKLLPQEQCGRDTYTEITTTQRRSTRLKHDV